MGEKNFSPEFRSYSTPEKKRAKKFKKLKNFFPALFLARRDEIGWEGEKKILGPDSADTGPRQENS